MIPNLSKAQEALVNSTGEQRTLVLMANFQENPNDRPLSQSDAAQLIFGQVSDFYYENSYQQTWLAGDVLGWFTLPLSRDACDLGGASEAAEQQAAEAGIDVGSYDRIIYLFTRTACGVDGTGTIGGSPSRARINGKFTADNIAHELGHNFGLYHSRALDCHGETLAENCSSIEYGDTYDVMGNPDFGHLNAFQKSRLGWLGSASSPAITTVLEDGTYTISAMEINDGQPKALRIPAGIDTDSGEQIWFYVEYRQALGFDSFLTDRSYLGYRGDVTHGVVIHRAVEGDPKSGALLHMNLDTPFRDLYGYSDWLDPALLVGAEYLHPNTGVVIRSDWADGESAGISVSLGEELCVASPAQVNIAVLEQSGSAGATLSYSAEISNVNSQACELSSFSLEADVPENWSGTLSTQQLDLEPGQTRSVVLSVTSSTSALAGDYTVQLLVSDTTDAVHDSVSVVTFQVESGSQADQLPPSTPTGLSAAESSRKVTLDWNSSSDNVAVQGYRVLRNGVVIGETETSSFADNSGSSGEVYEYRVLAFDAVGNLSLPSEPVSASRSKRKGGNDGDGGSGKGKGKK